MKTLIKVVLVSVLFVSTTSFAEEGSDTMASSSGNEPNPWTKCGIGAMIFQEYPIPAAISNIIWDLGTTAVTSAASSKDTCYGKDTQTAMFIQETYANLEEETAKGEGQYVSAMLNILGCESTSHSNIVNAIRTDFSMSVSDPAYAEKSLQSKAESYYNIVMDKVASDYAQQCQVI